MWWGEEECVLGEEECVVGGGGAVTIPTYMYHSSYWHTYHNAI